MSLTPRRQRRRTAGAGLALLSLLALAPAARADDDHRPAAVPRFRRMPRNAAAATSPIRPVCCRRRPGSG